MQAPEIGGVRVRQGDGQTIRLARGASLTDLAEKINVDVSSLVQVLFNLGEMVTATQTVSEDTLQVLGAELNYKIEVVSPEDEDRELLESFDIEFGENEGGEEDLAARPPVVTVMGHVDHGKTKLLDAIRKTNVVAGEAGGITQAIGAYQVATEVDGEERKITFIDTPGHEAFTAMRARGAKSTDIAVLVVAADDGVMPQTIEALNHALAADVPIVVAVNKIDKEGADPTKVRGQLTEYGLVPEEYGGDTMFVDVSAITGVGLDELLEAVILTADAALDLRANPDMDGQGVAIEAHLDKGRGPVATVLVQRGTLHVGDSIVAGPAHGRVRALLDDHGDNVDEAPPSFPVQVLGLTAVPGAGDSFLVVDDDRMARQIAERRASRLRMAAQAAGTRRKTLDQLFEQLEKGETQELRLILKGDGAGSVEALEDALSKIDVGDEVSLRVIDRGVGAITETNVWLAAASDAVIVGFNVRPQGKATELADREGVDIRYYSVIYAAIDEIEAALKGMLKPIYEEAQLGQAEIREIFRSSRAGIIAGCMVIDGTIRRNAKARLLREGVVVAETTIASLAGRRTTSPRSGRGSSAASRSPTTPTSGSATSSRRSRCGRRLALSRSWAGRGVDAPVAVRSEVDPGCRSQSSWSTSRALPTTPSECVDHARRRCRQSELPGEEIDGIAPRVEAGRPDQGDRGGDAGAADQGSAAGVHHGHRRAADRGHPGSDGVLHGVRLRRTSRPGRRRRWRRRPADPVARSASSSA